VHWVTLNITGRASAYLLLSSQLQTMGLGDEGLEGIRRFCKQHKCNSICNGFNLPKLSTIDLVRTAEEYKLSESNADNLDRNGEIVGSASGFRDVESLEI
jgi:hypothetical protein